MSSIRFGSFFLFLRVVYVRSLHSVHWSWIVGRASTLAIALAGDAGDGAGADGPAALADGEAHDEDEHGEIAHLLACRPGHLLQFGPRFVQEAAESTHGSLVLSCDA